MNEQSNETKIAVLQEQFKTLREEVTKINTSIRWGVLALLGVIISGLTKLFGF